MMNENNHNNWKVCAFVGTVILCMGAGAWEQVITDTSGYVTLTATDAGGTHSFSDKGHWSDGKAPEAGKKYLVNGERTFRSPDVAGANYTFAGDSLTFDNAYMNMKGADGSLTFTNLQLYACRLANGNANSAKSLKGNFYLHGTTRNTGGGNGLKGTATVFRGNEPFRFMIETPVSQDGRTCYLENSFRGDGDLSFEYTDGSGSSASHDPSHGSPTYFRILGTSPEFTGTVQLSHWAVRTVITNELALGGAAPAFRADRLLFVSNGILRVESDVVLKEPTRGITLSDFGIVATNTGHTCGGTFEVLAGATLTVSNVIAGVGQLRKTQDGTLVLAGDNTFSGQFSILKGRVTATHPHALGAGKVAAREGVALRIETDAGIAKPSGFSIVTNAGFVPLPVELAAFDSPREGVIEATIFDIAGASSFDTSSILVQPGGLGSAYNIEVLTEPSASGLRVFARATARGMYIIFR